MKYIHQIGITETGDPGLNLNWESNLRPYANIIITKHLENKAFRDLLIKYKDRIILHATITGWGSTWIEPGVQPFDAAIDNVVDLVTRGFPANQIVLRVDPIIPHRLGIAKAQHVIIAALTRINGLKRIRFSVMDLYPHVYSRLMSTYGMEAMEIIQCYPVNRQDPSRRNFHAAVYVINCVAEMIEMLAKTYTDVRFEVCAEPNFHSNLANVEHVSCISKYDMQALQISELELELVGAKEQRKHCHCPANKVQILGQKPGQCESKCIYCYWKD